MGFVGIVVVGLVSMALWRLTWRCWVSPMRAYRKLKSNGFGGPTPTFPMGNLRHMRKMMITISSSDIISHDIHSSLLPYFSVWQKLHGKVFMYWLGTEPFVYIAEPEFLKSMSSGVMGKSWGKPEVFKRDRRFIFGKGLVMVDGHQWARNRQVAFPAFSRANVKTMTSLMVDSTTNMLNKWTKSGKPEIDVEREIGLLVGEIIAKAGFGMSYENGIKVFEKLRTMQMTMFKPNNFIGVPYATMMNPTQSMKAKRLGKELDDLLLSIISTDGKKTSADLLGLLLGDEARTSKELLDECKTFLFGGQDTTSLALAWTLLLLAEHPAWQDQLREEIREVVGDKELDSTLLNGLKKMSWVMNEVLRLYPPATNLQRQAQEDIKVKKLTIPKGTNILIDIVSMHHDRELWGDDVHEFKPERFRDDPLYGGCSHKMGFLPFGYGGRMCIGLNLTMMQYRVVLTLILSRFSFSISQTYRHSPYTLLTLRPAHGLPLIVQPVLK